jgi:metal-responsive CopG/Arc/MetJ family transcriptional regulator
MRTTITLNDKLYRALKMRSAETDGSISKFVEDAIRYQILEDLEDIDDALGRKGEPEHSFDDLVKELKAEGLL